MKKQFNMKFKTLKPFNLAFVEQFKIDKLSNVDQLC